MVALNLSPFTGEQQVQDWGGNLMEASVVWPAMTFTTAQPWIVFLRALKGQSGVFQFNSAFMSAYSGDIGSRFWGLKNNTVKWSVTKDRAYSLSFDIREAI